MAFIFTLICLGVIFLLIVEFVGMVFLMLAIGICIQTGGFICWTIAIAIIVGMIALKTWADS